MKLFKKLLGAGAMLALVLPLASPVTADDAKPLAGQHITVLLAEIPDIVEPLKDKVSDFTAKTGIDVTIETVPEADILTKTQLVLSSGSADYDAVFSASINAAGPIEAGWFTPIDDLLGADFDRKDFPPLLLDLVSENGKLYGLPIRAETLVLMYRKDVLEKAGIAVPTTLDELTAAAQKVTDSSGGNMFGTAVRGAKNQGAYTYTFYLRNFGGKFFDEKMNPQLNSKEAVAALDYYVSLANKYAPRGSAVYTWEDVFNSMQLGRTAMIIESSIQAGTLEDPEKSKVVGKVGYAVPPAGAAGNFPDLKTYGYFVSSYSKHKEAAAEFVKWATGAELQQYAFDKYKFAALTRSSVMDYAFQKAPFFKAIEASMGVGDRYFLPPFAELGQVYVTLSDAVSNALAGTQTSQQALDQANDQIREFMKNAGYYDKKPVPDFIAAGKG
jgi:ABC-type glycerol-3-phosphate transport system substrate-binding protein